MENKEIEMLDKITIMCSNKENIFDPNFILETRKILSAEQLINKLNISKNNLYNIIKRADNYKSEKWILKRGKNGGTNMCNNLKDEIIKLAGEKLTKIEISKRLNISYQILLQYIIKNNLSYLFKNTKYN